MINAQLPAFPIQKPIDMNGAPTGASTPGLTKREYFASMVLQGIVNEGKTDAKTAAAQAVAYADSLISALE